MHERTRQLHSKHFTLLKEPRSSDNLTPGEIPTDNNDLVGVEKLILFQSANHLSSFQRTCYKY